MQLKSVLEAAGITPDRYPPQAAKTGARPSKPQGRCKRCHNTRVLYLGICPKCHVECA